MLTFGQQPSATPDQLAAEEARLRAQAAQQQVIPGFAEACSRIQMSGRGFPPLGGAAAQMFAALGGQSIAPGSSYAGQGDLARMPVAITDPLHVLQLANELAPQVQQPAPAPVASPAAPQPVTMPFSILPPDAPPSIPHLAAKPIEGFPFPQIPTVAAAPQLASALPFTFPPAQQPQGPIGAALPPSASTPPIQAATVPLPSSPVAPASPAVPAPSPADAPKTRGRKPKADVPAPMQVGTVTLPIHVGELPNPSYRVFVDCTPNVDSEPLAPYIDAIVGELVSRFCPTPYLPDLRCAPKDGPLGFGGWRGALRAIVLEKPPAAGTYTLRARGDEIAEEVAAAMLTVCNKSGGLYVR